MRPGVHTTTSGLCLNMASWLFTSFFPPHTRQLVTSVNWANRCSTSNVCVASSRVGLTIRTRVAAVSLGRYRSRSRKGSTNAAVLPNKQEGTHQCLANKTRRIIKKQIRTNYSNIDVKSAEESCIWLHEAYLNQ
jgi:hypothetical protein